MPVDLPELYFRLKDNGAAVFRVDPENRQKRIDLDQIANVNLRNGEIKAQGKSVVTAEEHAVIEAWPSAAPCRRPATSTTSTAPSTS